MEKKQFNIIKRFLRDLSKKGINRAKAEKLAQVGPCTWQCAICGDWLYNGAKTLEKAILKLSAPSGVKVRISKHEMDHMVQVENPVEWDGWDAWMERLFCDVDDFQCLCVSCHVTKTNEDAKIAKLMEEEDEME